jgi:hypothetical protein
MKAALFAMSLMTCIATPTLAQSFDPDLGTGNIVPWSSAETGENAYAGALNSYEATDVGSAAYCMRRFKSYDPRSESYLGYDGRRHHCF